MPEWLRGQTRTSFLTICYALRAQVQILLWSHLFADVAALALARSACLLLLCLPSTVIHCCVLKVCSPTNESGRTSKASTRRCTLRQPAKARSFLLVLFIGFRPRIEDRLGLRCRPCLGPHVVARISRGVLEQRLTRLDRGGPSQLVRRTQERRGKLTS